MPTSEAMHKVQLDSIKLKAGLTKQKANWKISSPLGLLRL